MLKLCSKMESPPSAGDVQEQLRLLRARVEEAVRLERFEEASKLKVKEREVLGSDEERRRAMKCIDMDDVSRISI